MNNAIDFAEETALIEANSPNQFPRQTPIYLFVAFDDDQIRAGTRDYRLTGTPINEWHGHVWAFELPDNVDAVALRQWVEDEILPQAQKVAAAYEPIWDGNNHVARFELKDNNADTVRFRLAEKCEDAPTLANDIGGLWDVGYWLVDATYHKATTGIQGVIDITPDTTDEALEKAAELIESEAADQQIVLDGDVLEYLKDLRELCRDKADE
jgi:hypothetical protein